METPGAAGLFMVFGFFRKSPNGPVIQRLHGEIMAAARAPALYRDYGVADTFDGRFEALALLATPAVRRLMALPEPGPTLAQELTDALFQGFDDALRQMGTSDAGLSRRMKKLAEAWLGRRLAYAGALAAGDRDGLAQAIARNLFAGARAARSAEVARVVAYIEAVEHAQANAPLNQIVKGPVPFPDPIQVLRATP